eukprot:COSAG01_NODE_74735_length_201_cov_436.921569_1_plen_51_part_10
MACLCEVQGALWKFCGAALDNAVVKQIRYIATLWNLIGVAHAAYLTKYGSY